MPSEKFLKDINAQKQIDKFVKIAKNKKIVLYGAGCFVEKLVSKYDLSNLNIIGITDKKFENDHIAQAYSNFKVYKPSELNKLDFDILLFSVLIPKPMIKQIKKDEIINKKFKNLYFKKSFWKNLCDNISSKIKKSNEHCIICNSNNLNTYFAKIAPFLVDLMFDFKERSTELLYCPNCNFSYFKLRPNDEQIGRYYGQYASEKFMVQRLKYEPELDKIFKKEIYSLDFRKNEMKKNISTIGSEMKNFTKILDYGGTGSLFPDDFNQNIIYSYDISLEETPNQPNFTNDINKIEKNSFDFIATTHVLEHLVNPRQAVGEMFSFLKKGGFLYIEVPDETGLNNDVSLLSQLFGNPYFQMHEHLNIFKKKNLRYMLKSFGFKILKCNFQKYPSSCDYKGYIWCLARKK